MTLTVIDVDAGGKALLITIKLKQSILIGLPTKAVFAYMSDLENLNDWSSAIITARKISVGAGQVGARVRCTIRCLGRWSEMTLEVVECEVNRCLTIKSISGVAPSLFCYQFEPGEDGGTIVSQESVIHYMEGIVDLTELVVTSAVRRQLAYDLQTLKDMLEAKSAMYEIAD